MHTLSLPSQTLSQSSARHWQPLVRVQREATTAMIQRAALMNKPCEFFKDFFGGRVPTLQEKLFWIEEALLRMTSLQIYENDQYLVELTLDRPFIRVTICRHDGQSCKNWKDFQRIKNELIGPEHEAVELFPSENRLIDTANEYHLWVHSDPTYRFPIGFNSNRFVLKEPVSILSADAHREENRPQAPARIEQAA